mgnify:CR=1 FL=1
MKRYVQFIYTALLACVLTPLAIAQSLSIVAPAISGFNPADRDAHFNWQFQSSGGGNVQIGQFACGSYWVAPANGDTGVKVLSLTGNPSWTDYISCDADPITENHGLMGTKHPAPGNTAAAAYGSYDSAENIIPNLPITYTPSSGSCVSLVAAIQRNETDTSAAGTSFILGEAVDAYCIITILPSVPANDGADMIRPNIVGTTKEFLTWDDFDLDRLPAYPFLSGKTTQEWEDTRIRWIHSTEVFGMLTEDTTDNFVKYSEGGRAYRSHLMIPNYGSGVAQVFSNDFLALLSSDNTLAEKKPALAAMIAYGLDIYHNRYNYGSQKAKAWSSGAGQSHGTFLPPVLASALLTDDDKANELRKVAITNHDDDQGLRGPHELRQATRGVTGVLLWGDNTPFVRSGNNINGEEREYWGRLVLSGCFDGSINACDANGGSKAVADPYGYIDGPPNTPGSHYVPVAIGGVRNYAAAMILMPSIRSITNTDDPIEYADRMSRHGLWTYPDPVAIPSLETQEQLCSIYDGSCPGFGTTWGADPSDVRFAIEDGTGRFTSMHGDSINIYNEASRSTTNWSTIIALYNGDTYEDNAVPLGTLVAPEIIFEFGSSPMAHMLTPNVLAEIRYTVNGSAPTSSSTLYTSPFSISENDVVRAKAFQSGKTASAVRTKTYTTPSLSDTTDPSVPSNLVYSNLYATSVDLDWDVSTDNSGLVSGYNVYTNGSNPQFVAVNLTTVSGLTPETSYSFTVSAVDAFGNESNQSSSVNITTLAIGQTTGAIALMLDFGPTSSSGSEYSSPAHETEAINQTQTGWNHLSTSGSSSGIVSSLIFSDSSNASGVSLTYGSSALGVKSIDFTASIGNTSALGSSANTGVYSSGSVATDAIWNLSGGSNDRSIGIRVDGLGAGDYKVFIMARNTSTSSAGMNTYAITDSSASSFNYSSESPVLINNDITANWSETGNYSEFDLTLASGESIYVISDGATSGENRGFLNAIQIVDNSSATDTQAPTVPSGLTSSNITTSSLDLSWTASTDNIAVTGYRVFRNSTQIGTTTTNSYSDSGLSESTSYTYTVSAYDAASNESAQSSSHNATTLTSVSEVIVDNTDTESVSITGSWASSTNTSGYHGSNYQHDGNTSKGSKSFTFTPALTTTTSYNVYIKYTSASNRANNVPVSINHTGGTTQVTVDQTTNGGSWNLLGNYSFNAGTSGSVIIGTTGTSAYVIADAVRFLIASGDTTAPTVPSGLSSSNITETSLDLSWTASTDNVAVTGYRVFRNSTQIATTTTNSYSDSGLNASTAYNYTVSAYDAASNESNPSATETVTTSAPPSIALMIDFGPTSPSGSMLTNSPGHDTSAIDSSDDTWNVVATSGSNSGTVSSLDYADGSSAYGISFTYGAASTGTTVVDFTATIGSSNNLGSSAGSGVYASGSIARDAIWNGGSSTSDLPIGIRVDGLDAGTYTIFVMGRNTNASSSVDMDVYAIAASNSSSYNFNSNSPTNISNSSTSSWVEDDNYAEISVALSSGQSLYIITDGSVSGGERGFLNAIQIVKE